MALIVKRNEDNQLINVRKYIIDDEGEESIWSNDWYGRHIIGRDCVWANVSKVQSNCNLPHVINRIY
jgi:hypothetical protein